MIIKQISVFVENRPGTLVEVLGVLSEHGINIRALSVADTADFGILRIIVNEPEKVERVLRGANLTVKMTPVITMTVGDKNSVMQALMSNTYTRLRPLKVRKPASC